MIAKMNKQNKDIYDLNTYDYFLPEDQIAQTPLEKRDESKLLVFNKKTSQISHKKFYIIKLL